MGFRGQNPNEFNADNFIFIFAKVYTKAQIIEK